MGVWKTRSIITIGFLESVILSGCIFGWVSLVHVLQQEGIYSHLCSNDIQGAYDIAGSERLQNKFENNVTVLESTTIDKNYDDSTKLPEIVKKNELFRGSETNTSVRYPICKEQSNTLTLIYTCAAVNYGMTAILIGFSLDHLGLWITRFLGSTMTLVGFVCLAFTTKDLPWLLWPAVNLIALGTNQLRFSTFQFSNLMPEKRTTILTAYSSGYAISTSSFLLFQLAHTAGISFKTMCTVFASVSALTFPATLLMPKIRIEEPITLPDPGKKSLMKERAETASTLSIDVSMLGSVEMLPPEKLETSNDEKNLQVPLSKSLFSLSAAFHLFWQFMNFFLLLFYSASFNAWAYMTTDDPRKVAFYNEMTGLCSIIGPILIPIAGLLTDWQITKASLLEDDVERLWEKTKATAFTMLAATCFILATMICKIFVTDVAVYISLVLIAISRPFTVGSCTTYVQMRFHPQHFNRLMGIFTTIVSLLSFLQYPVFIWMYSSQENYTAANLVLIAFLVVTYVSPLHIMIPNLGKKYASEMLMKGTTLY